MEKGGEVGELIVKTVRRRRGDGTIVEEETMLVKFGGMETQFDGGRRAKLPNYHLSGRRDIVDAHTFTRPPAGSIGKRREKKRKEEEGNATYFTQFWPVAMTSTIKRQYMMQPEVDNRYKTLIQRRLVSNTIKERVTKPVMMEEVYQATRDNMSTKGTAFDQAFHSAQQAKLEARGEASKGTRERLDPATLRSRLFELFSRKDHYMVKDLNRELQQPDRHLRETLHQIARMHNTGPFRNHFELKPEFKGAASGGGKGGS
ncbi:unnamed protein product [Discosporangium mesarthrocarpum]